jgi:hypothetical protein
MHLHTHTHTRTRTHTHTRALLCCSPNRFVETTGATTDRTLDLFIPCDANDGEGVMLYFKTMLCPFGCASGVKFCQATAICFISLIIYPPKASRDANKIFP